MPNIAKWVDHRMEVMGIEKWKDLCEITGVGLDSLRQVAEGSIDEVQRSQRRLVAAALRVPLNSLEKLGHGQIDWIGDECFFDPADIAKPPPGKDGNEYWRPEDTRSEDRGTPVIGRILSSGRVELDEDWNPDWGCSIGVRYGRGVSIYALVHESAQHWVVLREMPVFQFREGTAVLYLWNGYQGEGWFGQVKLSTQRRDSNARWNWAPD